VKEIAGNAERGPVVASAVVLGALALLTLTVLAGYPVLDLAPAMAVGITAAVAYRTLLAWQSLLALLILVILFIPMRRYVLPGSLPFELEPYRLLVAFVLAGWTASLLVDPRVRLRRSGLEAPLVLLVIAALGSLLANSSRVATLEKDVVKDLTFFLSFLVIFFLIVSVVRTYRQVDVLVKFLCGGGAVVAVLAVIESRTHYNVFNHLASVVPLLEPRELATAPEAGRGLRSYASAQHPIALGAALVMLIPLAVYLVHSSRLRRWWLAAGLLVLGALATVSRTSVIMLVVVCLVFLWLRPAETKRLWPALVPVLLAVHIALPGTLGTLKNSFFPPEGLIAEQKANVGFRGQGRIADLGPGLSEWAQQPLFGQGYGTRIVELSRENAQILDNQWLGTLIETGLAGVVGWFWLMSRSVRRFARGAKEDPSPRGWLLAALAASVMSFAISMFTYDAFAFIQVTLLLFILLGLGCVLLAGERARVAARRKPAAAR